MKWILSFSRCLLFVLGATITTFSYSAETVHLYLYNTPPPFHPDSKDNLSDYLAKWLSKRSDGMYRFKAVYLPRKRLDRLIRKEGWKGMVVWANPEWFKDLNKTHYLWSDPLATDYNLVLSNRENPVEYEMPSSLKNLKLGGILGHVYAEFNSLLDQGALIREDASTYQQNLMKLKAQRLDVIFLPSSAFGVLKKDHPKINDWIYISKRPRNKFDYYLFCDDSHTELMSFINKEIKQLSDDPKWQETFSGMPNGKY